MQFNIDGRIQVALRPGHAAWTVQSAPPDTLPKQADVASFVARPDTDITPYLDVLCRELDGAPE